jgi:hypothetical protein
LFVKFPKSGLNFGGLFINHPIFHKPVNVQHPPWIIIAVVNLLNETVITGVFLVYIRFGETIEIKFQLPSLKQMQNIGLVCTSPVPVEGDY